MEDFVDILLFILLDKQKNKRNKPPKKQNAWSIFLKNYGEYLRKTFPDEKFPLKNIVSKARPEWNGLNDNDVKKRYFKILEKVAEANRQYFLKNGDYLIQSKKKEKYKWKMCDPSRRNNTQNIQHSPDSNLVITIEEIEKIAKDLKIDTPS